MNEITNNSNVMHTPIEIALDIDADGNTTARKLYAFLELDQKNYSRWCKANIIDNEFAEKNADYWVFFIKDENPLGGRPTQDYKLTAHFAKKLSVKGSGKKAEEAREYFTTLEEKVKQKAIDRSTLSPQLQMLYTMIDNQAKVELEQKRQAEQQERLAKQITRVEKKQDTIAETFTAPTDTEDFKTWVNKRIGMIAESKKFDKGMGKNNNYSCARAESYQRLRNKWNCNLDDRVARAKGRALERNPSITKTQLNAINKLTVIAEDKTLKPIYETVIKEMMIAHCVAEEDTNVV